VEYQGEYSTKELVCPPDVTAEADAINKNIFTVSAPAATSLG
jgi:hypothetical protein